MKKPSKKLISAKNQVIITEYDAVLSSIVELLELARRTSARAINAMMTATYWEIGRRIVEFEQGGKSRAEYGEQLLDRLSQDLSTRFGRGFSIRNLRSFRGFYANWSIRQTLSAESSAGIDSLIANSISLPGQIDISSLAQQFPLPWSHYVSLLAVKNPHAKAFYETEAIRNGWSVRQLNRQINSLFYERTALSRNKAAMLTKGVKPKPEDTVTPEEEIKDPLVLEFLGLKDEYSESEMEEALIRHLESFLLELGSNFAFIGRQKRLRIGDQWFRVDLLFFHRRLRCLLVIDLKIGKFTHADAGQMHMYLNYAREHWTHPDENPPVGLILCAEKDAAVAHYALEGLSNKVLAAEYRTTLPDEETIVAEMEKTRKIIETRKSIKVSARKKIKR
jgi:predicted nuclease of restriction endonuclease-like (RecB) superfamily